MVTTIGIRAKLAMAGIGTSSAKFDVMKFVEQVTSSYGRGVSLLVKQGMVKALYGTKPNDTPDIDWKELKAKAVATIQLCLGDDVMYHVMDEESSVIVWLKLESQYMSKSLTNKLSLKQWLYELKMAESSDLSQHINVFNQVIRDLKRVDVKFEDEDKALMLLNSFPVSTTYENWVTTLTWGKESLELEDVTGALLAFHQRKKVNDKSSQGEWLIVKGNQERGRSSNKGDSNGKNSQSKSKKRKGINYFVSILTSFCVWTKSLMRKDVVKRDSTCQSIFRRLCTTKKIEDFRFPVSCPDDMSSCPDVNQSAVPSARTTCSF
jgi:hypothetical protein